MIAFNIIFAFIFTLLIVLVLKYSTDEYGEPFHIKVIYIFLAFLFFLIPLANVIMATVIIFIFGEILPKNIARANANKLALFLAYPVYFLMIIFTPFIYIFKGIVWLVKKIFKLKESADEVFDDDDFQDVVEKISDEGVIDEEDSEIIIAAVDWGDTVVSEVLTKRSDIVAIDIKNCNEKYLREFLISNTYSRIHVY